MQRRSATSAARRWPAADSSPSTRWRMGWAIAPRTRGSWISCVRAGSAMDDSLANFAHTLLRTCTCAIYVADMSGFRDLRGNHDFTVLWVGQTISELGSRMSMVVFPLLAYAITYSTLWAAAAEGLLM